jgi:hypothetical protein
VNILIDFILYIGIVLVEYESIWILWWSDELQKPFLSTMRYVTKPPWGRVSSPLLLDMIYTSVGKFANVDLNGWTLVKL